jgi:hypothetical protein
MPARLHSCRSGSTYGKNGETPLIYGKYSEVLWQGRWCLLLQSVIVICVARKVTALAVGVGLLELGEPKCVRELVELCR